MIFKLFKSKNNWQHKDVNIRIKAINDELNLQSNDDKSILYTLLNEDNSELVRRAVLLKFNNLDEYFNAVTDNNNKKVQGFAVTQVEAILAGQHQVILSLQEKQQFLTNLLNLEQGKAKSKATALLNFWFEHETEPSITISLFEQLIKKKNIAQFLLQVFAKKQVVEIQEYLLSLDFKELDDESLLAKLNKKAVNENITHLINNKLAQLVEKTQRPKKILKQSQLILSKLLALKDQPSYAKYSQSKINLDRQWQEYLTEINCLSDDEQQVLLNKYNKITTQLEQIFAPKAEAYQQEKIAEKLANDKRKAQQDFTRNIAALNQQITTAVFEGTNTEHELLNQDEFSTQLAQLRESITTSVLNTAEQNEFLEKTTLLKNKLSQLPEIAESVSEATYLISKISQLTLPHCLNELNSRQQTYYDWLTSYKAVNKKAQGVLPQSIIDAQKEISTTWQQGLKPLQQEQRDLFDQTKKKLHDLKRLLASGKYKVCFGLFKGVSQAIVLLSSQQQQQLQRDFDTVSEKIAEISDWEHYIATPRKQELLIEINTLINTPLDDPNAQADQVKHYRKIWNSLGHADESIDKDLNKQFNIACEQAFTPCRLFYAEQEKLRAMHLVDRTNIINDANQLAASLIEENSNATSSPINIKALDGKLNKLQQRWQQAGEVDRQTYQKLFKTFKNKLQPIKKAIRTFHDANAIKKQNLIAEAKQQLTVDDIYQAIETIKQLQQQWRNIGFSGSQQESKLWQTFRTINDQVFAKRDFIKSAQQAQLTQVADKVNQTLEVIKASVDGVAVVYTEKNNFLKAKEKAETLLSQVTATKPVIKSLVSNIENFILDLKTKITHINSQQETKNWHSLFELLKKVAQNNSDMAASTLVENSKYQDLTSFWQKKLLEQCSLSTQVSNSIRAEKTLALEILAQTPSPAELAQQRMAVQVSLMQEQMQSSAIVDLQQIFVDWLSLGKLKTVDIPLLTRVEKIFIA